MLASDTTSRQPTTPMADLAPYSSRESIIAVRHDEESVTVEWSDRRRSTFPALWLRDNCACSECRHPKALERLYIFIDNPAPQVRSATADGAGDLQVQFSAGAASHTSVYTRAWLRAHDAAAAPEPTCELRPQLWSSDIFNQLARIDYGRYAESTSGLREWIVALKTFGIVLLQGIPPVSGKLLEVARRIGPVRVSNFGEYYDVVSMPNPNASAYTPMGLELHTDLANWRFPPDIQLLFCLKSSVTGGESVFADGFRVAEALRQQDAAAFTLLTTHAIDFRFHDDTCDIRSSAPVIETDRAGAVTRIRFNNWLRAATVFPDGVAKPMYAALGKFWTLLRKPEHQLNLRLAPGELIAYNNHRILHGRLPFDANSGERHLQGCYVNLEDVDSTLRVLARQSR